MIFINNLEFFAGKWAKVQLPKFYPLRPLGSLRNAMKILTLNPNSFNKLGKSFLGVGAPGH